MSRCFLSALLVARANLAQCNSGESCNEPDEDFITLSLASNLKIKADGLAPNASEPGFDTEGSFEQVMEAAEGHHWSYKHPDHWVKSFPYCEGNRQSPINIEDLKAKEGKLKMTPYYSSVSKGLKMKNNGHALQVNGNFGKLKLHDGVYDVKQLHFHFPSEHKVNGELAAGEMHIVHQHHLAKGRGTDALAVVGVLLEVEDVADKFFDTLGFGGKLPANKKDVKIAGAVDLSKVLKSQLAGDYFYYEGSLTTPPCSETVHWYLLKDQLNVSAAIVKKFKSLFPNPMNNRPVQKLNGRVIHDVTIDGR